MTDEVRVTRFMAPELFDAWEDETVPAKTLASDCYAFGQAIVEVRCVHCPAFFYSCDDDKRLKQQLLSGQKPWFEYPQENLVFMAITRGHRAKRPETEMAKQWMTDPVWALVQSAYPGHMKWVGCIHPCRALISVRDDGDRER